MIGSLLVTGQTQPEQSGGDLDWRTVLARACTTAGSTTYTGQVFI